MTKAEIGKLDATSARQPLPPQPWPPLGYCEINEVGKLVHLVGEKFLSGGRQQLGHFL